jgi:flagellar basal body rod protein FlgG
MEPSLENAATAMRNKVLNIQIVANNLANLNSTAFKRGLAFSDVLDEEQNTLQRKLTDFSEGVFEETGNPLNAAISGKAYFTVKTPEGDHLTRNGDFVIDTQGFLATREGFRVMGENGEINLQEELIDSKTNISITKNGEIRSGDKIVSKLKMMTVADEQTLTKAEGQRFFNEDKEYIVAIENEYEIHHGYLESSNTNAILEMQAMIQLQKDYEAAQKVITSLDTILSQESDLGKV